MSNKLNTERIVAAANPVGGQSAEQLGTNQPKPEPRSPRVLPVVPDSSAVEDLKRVLDGQSAEIRERHRKALNDPKFLPYIGDTLEETRASLIPKLQALSESGIMRASFRKENGGTGSPLEAINSLESIACIDLSLTIKSGVQWGLWGGAVDALGTERHKKYAQGAMDLSILGCYGMTELGHGSNVMGLETTATYDPETQEFVIHSPSETAKKVYIGNAARDGQMAAVFAQLYTPDQEESHGVHCLVVPIRDAEGNVLPGVTITDHGRKGGLLGVDNGTLSFDHVRIPRENLLNRFADVDEEGHYSSPIDSLNRRFFTMLGTLIRGRIAVGASAVAATRASLDIAIRYATRRRQFKSAKEGEENLLLNYRQHRRRLLIPLARTYALSLLQNQIAEQYTEMTKLQYEGKWDVDNPTDEQSRISRELESLAPAVKAASSHNATKTIQECREACGGAGYMAENLLTTFKADSDVFTTFEGDNTVLLQLMAKNSLTAFGRDMQEASPWDFVKYSVDSVADVVRRRTGVATRLQSVLDTFNLDQKSLFDADSQVHLLEQREKVVFASLLRRMQSVRKGSKADAVPATDKAQDHMIDASWARIDSMLLDVLVEKENELEEGSAARKVFEQLRHLFFFDAVVRHAGWYQEHNLLSGGRVKAARAAVNDLVDSLGPWATVLVDAFAVPSFVSDVPMLRDSGVDTPAEQ